MEFVIYCTYTAYVHSCILQWQLKLAPLLFTVGTGLFEVRTLKEIKQVPKESQGSDGVSGEGGMVLLPHEAWRDSFQILAESLHVAPNENVWQQCHVRPKDGTNTWTFTKYWWWQEINPQTPSHQAVECQMLSQILKILIGVGELRVVTLFFQYHW